MKVVINPAYKRIEDFIQNIPDVFKASGEILYEGRNLLKRFKTGNTYLIVKRFKTPHLINRFAYAYLRKSKACRSYECAFRLLENGINTPDPIAFTEDYKGGLLAYSYYISDEITEAYEIREFWFHPEKLTEEAFVLEAFGRFTADMHKKKILHKDYSSGNILYKIHDGKVMFYLVDINRIRFDKPVSEEEGYESLKRLWLNDDVFILIARSYAKAMGYDINHAVERILYYKNSFMKRYT
jgi:tRNA A-37 threonylcarbamoyl transferase component Bud32